MNLSPKNKKELITAINREPDFKVLKIATGNPQQLINELKKMSTQEVTMIVLKP